MEYEDASKTEVFLDAIGERMESVGRKELGQFACLIAILSRKIHKVRVLKGGNQRREETIEIPFPSLDELFPLIEWPPKINEAAQSLNWPNEPGQFVPSNEPDFTSILEALAHSSKAVEEQSGSRSKRSLRDSASQHKRHFTGASELHDRDHSFERDATLDFVWDGVRQMWKLILTPSNDLRGEDLSEPSHRDQGDPNVQKLPEPDLRRDDFLTAAEAADFLGVAKSTVTRRMAQNQLVGIRVFKHAFRIPKEQFMDFDVVPGIPDALKLFERVDSAHGGRVDHKAAWLFLVSKVFRGDPNPRPIDKLRRAAREHATGQVVAELARVKQSLDRGEHL